MDIKTKINQLFLIDEKITSSGESYTIPANSAIFLYVDFGKEEKAKYYISTFNSDKKNMRLTLSSKKEGTDTIIQNYFPLYIYADKDSSEYQINVKKYLLRYAIFGAVDPY